MNVIDIMDHYSTIATKLIRLGEPRIKGAVNIPVFQSAMFEYRGETDYHDLGYTRLNNNPTIQALQHKLTGITGGESVRLTSSGMAAIATTLYSLLGSGDHILVQRGVYGGTHGLIQDLFPKLNIGFDFIDATDPSDWNEKIKKNTKAVYTESITNPILEIADHESIINFCNKLNLISIIDNTFLTPINFQPINLGYDISIHSGTKYLNGHQDIIIGLIAGKKQLIEPISRISNHIGGSPDPQTCYLFYRGLKTLALRILKQNESAFRIAKFFEDHPSIKKVNYPGLSSHTQYDRAQKLFNGTGGMVSFEIFGGEETANDFIDRVSLATHAVSLGGIETLIIKPSGTTHASLSENDKEKFNISSGLIRLSVGIEDTEDLIQDFDWVLKTMNDKSK